MSRILSLAVAAILAVSAVPQAFAEDPADFMNRFSGKWMGTGSLLFGPEKGLEFNCELEGTPSRTHLTFGMRGRCWMGVISGPVFAQIRYSAEQDRFFGQFLDGAEGDGLDIVGTKDGEGFLLNLSRGQAQGSLRAEAVGDNQMKVLISYRDRVNDRYLPIAAMGFTRSGAAALGLPDYLPEDRPGSLARRN